MYTILAGIGAAVIALTPAPSRGYAIFTVIVTAVLVAISHWNVGRNR